MRCCKLITGFPEVVFSSPWSYAQWTWEWMCWLSAVLLMAMVQEVAAALAPLPFFWLLQSLLWNFLSLLSYTCNLWPQIQPHIWHETYCVCSQWTSYMLRDMHVLRALSPWVLHQGGCVTWSISRIWAARQCDWCTTNCVFKALDLERFPPWKLDSM